MTLQYNISINDYLQYHLYFTSQSTTIKKKNRINWLITVAACLMLAFLFYDFDKKFLMYAFLAMAIASLLFYPLYQKNHQYNYYKDYIETQYKDRFTQPCKVELATTGIETSDFDCTSKFAHRAIASITETGNYIYITMKRGAGSIIIPKQNIDDAAAVVLYLKSLAAQLNISYTEALNWKW